MRQNIFYSRSDKRVWQGNRNSFSKHIPNSGMPTASNDKVSELAEVAAIDFPKVLEVTPVIKT